MEIREFEKLITITPGRRMYCTVCQTFAYEGEFYKLKANKFIGRHLTCIPKNPPRPAPTGVEAILEQERDSRAVTSDKRRRAGGHGYTGGDGWTSL